MTISSCGYNRYGQLCYCLDNKLFNETPQNITSFGGLSKVKVKAVFCGIYHTFIYTNNNKLLSCGLNIYGQIGRKTKDNLL